jgi:hypothetical protein
MLISHLILVLSVVGIFPALNIVQGVQMTGIQNKKKLYLRN